MTEIKKLNLDKLNIAANKSDAYRYITSSVDNRGEGGKTNMNNLTNVNFDIGMRIMNNKNNSFSPTKIGIDSSNRILNEKEKTISFNNVLEKSEIINQNNVINAGLNDIILSMNKNVENKSRNAQRNNLTSTKSNLFSSDKAQSMQSGSYQKNHMFTQVTSVKTTTNINTGNKTIFKPKTTNTIINKPNNVYKPSLNVTKSLNKSKANLDVKLKTATSKANFVVKKTINTSTTTHNLIFNQSMLKKPKIVNPVNNNKIIIGGLVVKNEKNTTQLSEGVNKTNYEDDKSSLTINKGKIYLFLIFIYFNFFRFKPKQNKTCHSKLY
jgi:hypothetical protein